MDNKEKEIKKGQSPRPDPQKEEQSKTADDGLDFFSVDEQAFNDFIGDMQKPKEPMDDAPFQFDEELEGKGEAVTDDDEGNLGYFNYEDEHRTTALFMIGMLDSGMGFLGMLATDLDPDRYMAFSQRTPPAYYVDAAAAVINKYQAKLSVEAMLITAIMMVYAPQVNKIRKDHKMVNQKNEKQNKMREMEVMVAAYKKSQNEQA